MKIESIDILLEPQEASFYGAVRILLIILFIYYASKFLMRLLAPYLMKKTLEKVQKQFEEAARQQQNRSKQTTAEQPQRNQMKSKPNKKVGEYIDYEEIE